jgi:hypothetical protein
VNTFVLTDGNRQIIDRYLSTLPGDGTYKVEVKKNSTKRSDAQNRLSHKWYTERGTATDNSPAQEKAYCKLTHGCPILIAENEEFAHLYRVAIEPLSYEDRLLAMQYIPVTSLMSVAQTTAYMTAVEVEAVSVGIMLSRPEDLYYTAMGYTR